jgi:hypothetical protein
MLPVTAAASLRPAHSDDFVLQVVLFEESFFLGNVERKVMTRRRGGIAVMIFSAWLAVAAKAIDITKEFRILMTSTVIITKRL